jgi:glycosyltransferase involved in cell wall biosynthesis
VNETLTVAKYISIGIIAWNEEKAIGPMLASLFQQSLFAGLNKRGLSAEVICIVNGSTDGTAEAAAKVFAEQSREHPESDAFTCRVMNVAQRGKINAWNLFVHSYSSRHAKFLFLMDADILIHQRDSLWNMLRAVESNREASVAVDRPCKDIWFKPNKTPLERLSLAASRITRSTAGQLCGQLYCIRAEVARNIYLPKDLAACEDGFIKALVCTDFLRHPVWTGRIQCVPEAAHTFEAYTSPAHIFKNQKRQMIGQTIVHVLVDDYLKKLPLAQRAKLAETLRSKEQTDPNWLKQLIAVHLRRIRFFWQLYPGLLTHRFQRLRRLSLLKKLACLPATVVGFFVTLISGRMAYETLKSGCTDYWPAVDRDKFQQFDLRRQRAT